jgi:hypothetical protein
MSDEQIAELTSEKYLAKYGVNIPGCFREISGDTIIDTNVQEHVYIMQILREIPDLEGGIDGKVLMQYSKKIETALPALKNLPSNIKDGGLKLLSHWISYIQNALEESDNFLMTKKHFLSIHNQLLLAGVKNTTLFDSRSNDILKKSKLISIKNEQSATKALTKIVQNLYYAFTSPTTILIQPDTSLKVSHLCEYSEDARQLLFSEEAYSFIKYTGIRHLDELEIFSLEQLNILLKNRWNCENIYNRRKPSLIELEKFSPDALKIIANSYINEIGIPNTFVLTRLQNVTCENLAITLSDPRILDNIPQGADLRAFDSMNPLRVKLICDAMIGVSDSGANEEVCNPQNYHVIPDDLIELLTCKRMLKYYSNGQIKISDFSGLDAALISHLLKDENLKFFVNNPHIKPYDFMGCSPQILPYLTKNKHLVKLYADSSSKVILCRQDADKQRANAKALSKKATTSSAEWVKTDAMLAEKKAIEAQELVEKEEQSVVKPKDFSFCDVETIALFTSQEMCTKYFHQGLKPRDFYGLESKYPNGVWKIKHLAYFSAKEMYCFFSETGLKPNAFKSFDHHVIRLLTSPQMIDLYKSGILTPQIFECFSNDAILSFIGEDLLERFVTCGINLHVDENAVGNKLLGFDDSN